MGTARYGRMAIWVRWGLVVMLAVAAGGYVLLTRHWMMVGD